MKRFTKEESSIGVCLYQAGLSFDKIAYVLDRNRTVVRGHLIKKVTVRTIYEAKASRPNPKVFTDFSLEPDAYFYGLLITDGCLTKEGYIRLVLKSSDSDIIHAFKDYVGTNSKVKDRNVAAEKGGEKKYGVSIFSFKDSLIKERLIILGFESNKSCNEKLPTFDWLNSHHFWRGVIDGDGTVKDNGGICGTISLCGGKELLEGFQNYAEITCGVVARDRVKRDFKIKADFYRVAYHGEDADKILRKLYLDSTLFIDRKKDRAIKIIEKRELNAANRYSEDQT